MNSLHKAVNPAVIRCLSVNIMLALKNGNLLGTHVISGVPVISRLGQSFHELFFLLAIKDIEGSFVRVKCLYRLLWQREPGGSNGLLSAISMFLPAFLRAVKYWTAHDIIAVLTFSSKRTQRMHMRSCNCERRYCPDDWSSSSIGHPGCLVIDPVELDARAVICFVNIEY